MPQLVTDGLARYMQGCYPPEQVAAFGVKKGRGWLRRAGLPTGSEDLAMLAYLCWRGMSELYRRDPSMDTDYLVAGDVLDEWVTDHDAELLCQLVPLAPEPEVGGMSRHVTAVHTALLEICTAIREAWAARDEEEVPGWLLPTGS